MLFRSKEFEERRQAAEKLIPHDVKVAMGYEEMLRIKKQGQRMKRRRAAGGVVKTAIWVAGVCYVVGVVGEVVNGA